MNLDKFDAKYADAPMLNTEDVIMVYTSIFYDHDAAGHAWYKGKYCFYIWFDKYYNDSNTGYELEFLLYEITGDTLIHELAERKMKEDIFGYKGLSPVYPIEDRSVSDPVTPDTSFSIANDTYFNAFKSILNTCNTFEEIDSHKDLNFIGKFCAI